MGQNPWVKSLLKQIGLSAACCDWLSHHVQEKSFLQGEYLFHHYMPQQNLIYIADGSVCLYDGQSQFYGAKPITNECVSFPSLKFDCVHSRSCRALNKVTALVIAKEVLCDFEQKFNQDYGKWVLWAGQSQQVLGRLDMGVKSGDEYRKEHDLLGERLVLDKAYYGIQSLRGLENFPVSGETISHYPHLIVALACIKKAAAQANCSLGLISKAVCQAIEKACDEIKQGQLHDQFVIDAIQGGAGTSTNMNANEVIANRALEHLGYLKGDYEQLHPLNHVNLSQSTNDVYPTAIKIASIWATQELIQSMTELRTAFLGKADQFASLVKIGRTQLQEAVPMTLGQEFGTYAEMLKEDIQRLKETLPFLCEINLGGTAIGTGIAAPKGFSAKVIECLAKETGLSFVAACNFIEATQDVGVFVQLSSMLKRTAVKLSKVCNDLRLLSSGPHAGFAEIMLPPMQAGSSIMPGKINPVIPELVNQVAFLVIGHDVTITMAAEAGQLQLNAFEPIIARCLFQSLTFLRRACVTLTYRCVTGIVANEKRLRTFVEHSIGLITAVMPKIGYEKATYVAQESLRTGEGIYQIILREKLLSLNEVEDLLKPDSMTTTPQGNATFLQGDKH